MNISFNHNKGKPITFRSPNPMACEIQINGKLIQWVNKVKYVGRVACILFDKQD